MKRIIVSPANVRAILQNLGNDHLLSSSKQSENLPEQDAFEMVSSENCAKQFCISKPKNNPNEKAFYAFLPVNGNLS